MRTRPSRTVVAIAHRSLPHRASTPRRGPWNPRSLRVAVWVACLLLPTGFGFAQGGPGPGPGFPPLPPVPVPAENPQSPEKVVLGKILFWDAQLSSDDSVACGTCHIPGVGGSDPRSFDAVHPGFDAFFGTADDVLGSPGVGRQACDGTMLEDAIFGWERQVTGRKSPTPIMAAYAPRLFWDGRATGTFTDPVTGVILIPSGAALESQAVGPIFSNVEMACGTRQWDEVLVKLASVTPLARATDLPPDIVTALAFDPDYPSLFAAAFGDPEIDAGRIAFALAAYQRTLIADETPFDTFIEFGPGVLTQAQNQGRQLFNQNCLPCHGGPLLTDQIFHDIGVRPPFEDLGRGEITGLPQHAGRFKTPTLRNVALRAPYFHNGGKATLAEVIDFYDVGGDFPNPSLTPLGLTTNQKNLIELFLTTVLTDPRVAAELPPFDRPTLQTYFRRGDVNHDGSLNISDPVAVLEHLFQGPTVLPCADAGDANDDGAVDLADVIGMLDRLFAGAPPLPAPSDRSTGPDPTPDALGCG